jgi:NAD(P)-dependent dehydrogenase (short-subunit alcohol dehydrogenase family)
VAEALIAAGARIVISIDDHAAIVPVANELGMPGIACDASDDAQLGALVQ